MLFSSLASLVSLLAFTVSAREVALTATQKANLYGNDGTACDNIAGFTKITNYGQWYCFTFGGIHSTSPQSFTAFPEGPTLLTVTDMYLPGDSFGVIYGASFAGSTPAVPASQTSLTLIGLEANFAIVDPDYSSRSFVGDFDSLAIIITALASPYNMGSGQLKLEKFDASGTNGGQFVVIRLPMPWENAPAACAALGLTFAHVTTANAHEVSVVMQEVSNNGNAWVASYKGWVAPAGDGLYVTPLDKYGVSSLTTSIPRLQVVCSK